MRTIIAFSLAVLLVPVSATGQTPAPISVVKRLDAFGLASLLKNGGYIILYRHERTEVPSRDDDYSRPPSDCRVQRNLSVAGMAGAVETGKALAVLEIPIGRVLASPMCRTMETARLAFGKVEEELLLLHHNTAGGRPIDVAGRELQSVVAAAKPEGANIVLVSHYQNIFKPYQVDLGEGDMAVLKRGADGQYAVIGTATGSDWGFAARRALHLKK